MLHNSSILLGGLFALAIVTWWIIYLMKNTKRTNSVHQPDNPMSMPIAAAGTTGVLIMAFTGGLAIHMGGTLWGGTYIGHVPLVLGIPFLAGFVIWAVVISRKSR